MRGAKWPFIPIAMFAVAVVGFLALRSQATRVLRVELEAAREQNRELARLHEENERLKAKQIAPADLERLRADHAAIVRLKEEVAKMSAHAERRGQPVPTATPAEASLGSVTDWKNVGRGTPDKLMQTLLWASAAGDVDTIASAIVFDGAGRARAEALLAGLPEQSRVEYRSPEKLIGLFLAKEGTAFASVQIVGQSNRRPDEVGLRVRVEYVDRRPPGETSFPMRRDDEGWKLLIPSDVVGRYAGMIKGAK